MNRHQIAIKLGLTYDEFLAEEVFRRLKDCPIAPEIEHAVQYCNVIPLCNKGCCYTCKEKKGCQGRCLRDLLIRR